MKKAEIKTASGNNISALIYEAGQNSVLIISSATGVKQGFYKKFADFVSANGITVITFDYSGIGFSLKQPIKQLKSSVSDWGNNDLEAIIRYTKENYQNAKITLLGHSIGGQIIGLAKSSSEVQKIILVAAQSGYWQLWKGFDRVKCGQIGTFFSQSSSVFLDICRLKELAEWRIYQRMSQNNGAFGDETTIIFLTKFQNKNYFSKTFQ